MHLTKDREIQKRSKEKNPLKTLEMTEKESICATESLTILSWEHNGDGAERSLAFGVVGTHFDAKWRKGQDALVPVHVTGLSRYGGDGVCPVDLPQRPESDDVAETVSVL